MINYKELEQGSIEWHEMRWKKIGGTLSKGLFVKSDTLFIDILSQYLEEFFPSESYESDAMVRGSEMEKYGFEYIEKYTGIKFEKSGWLQSQENELLGISPDGITECETIACEIKCFGRKKHTEVLLDQEIPLENINQCVHYFTVNPKLKKLYFIAYRPESVKPFIKELTLDSLIDVGFKKKIEIEVIGKKGFPIAPKIEAVKDLKTVRECVKYTLNESEILLKKIKENINQLNF
ncbi:MAG: YqaJ viral recombinase family protein [Ferruginibacter sp.]|nr:YqaJ viral recombinase family protein [Ferruginibacter sp.]